MGSNYLKLIIVKLVQLEMGKQKQEKKKRKITKTQEKK